MVPVKLCATRYNYLHQGEILDMRLDPRLDQAQA